MPANICVPLFKAGNKDITVKADGAITGKRMIVYSDAFESGPVITTATLPATYDGGNIEAATCGAGLRASGIAAYDAASGTILPMIRGKGTIAPVTSGAAITAPAEVEVGTNGRVITLASGIAVGRATTDAAGADVDCYIELY